MCKITAELVTPSRTSGPQERGWPTDQDQGSA
jgi:hypothetical protein